MYLLTSAIIDSILDKYTEKVNSKSGYYKIPYESWRLLKKLASSDLIFEVETKLKNQEIHLCLTSDSLHYEIPVTYGFVDVMKERLIKMTDTNSTYPMPAKKKTALNMNFDFGPINDGVAISPYGLAILAADGRWLTYNPATAQTVEVTGFTFDFKGMIYKIPATIKDISVGDLIIHQKKPMYVTEITDSNIGVVDIINSEVKTVIPITNMFGFNFITKIVSFLNFGSSTPTEEQPFGNIMPIIMASMVFNEDEDSTFGNMDMSKLMMISMLSGNPNPFGNMFNFNLNTQNK